MNDSLLCVENVHFGYRQNPWRLKNISLQLAAGCFIGIIGPNGAGKSTLLKIAAGLLPCSEGSVRLMGGDIGRLSRRRIARHLGYLPQNVTSAYDYRVEELVAMGRYCRLDGIGFLRAEDLDIIECCLAQTETADFRRRRLSQLSGGERRRVLLAGVLAQQPRILLLDEPTAGLDLHHQVAFFGLLGLLSEKGMAVAVVTHDLNLASQFCRTLLLLHNGQTVVEGPPETVIRQEVLSGVYRRSALVAPHPISRKPIVLPVVPSEGPADSSSIP